MVYLGYNNFIPYFTDLHIFALMEPEFPEFPHGYQQSHNTSSPIYVINISSFLGPLTRESTVTWKKVCVWCALLVCVVVVVVVVMVVASDIEIRLAPVRE